MPDLSNLDHLCEDVAVAHCRRCDRTSALDMHGDGFWCGWCGKATQVTLRRAHVLREDAATAHAAGGQFVDPENVPLQPLRIPAGWRVHYNNGLYAVQPTEETVPCWWIFKEDMLVLIHDGRQRLLDLGWAPEMNHDEGRYRLTLHDGVTHDGEALLYFETRDLPAVVAEIERILAAVACGRL